MGPKTVESFPSDPLINAQEPPQDLHRPKCEVIDLMKFHARHKLAGRLATEIKQINVYDVGRYQKKVIGLPSLLRGPPVRVD